MERMVGRDGVETAKAGATRLQAVPDLANDHADPCEGAERIDSVGTDFGDCRLPQPHSLNY